MVPTISTWVTWSLVCTRLRWFFCKTKIHHINFPTQNLTCNQSENAYLHSEFCLYLIISRSTCTFLWFWYFILYDPQAIKVSCTSSNTKSPDKNCQKVFKTAVVGVLNTKYPGWFISALPVPLQIPGCHRLSCHQSWLVTSHWFSYSSWKWLSLHSCSHPQYLAPTEFNLKKCNFTHIYPYNTHIFTQCTTHVLHSVLHTFYTMYYTRFTHLLHTFYTIYCTPFTHIDLFHCHVTKKKKLNYPVEKATKLGCYRR